MFIIYNDGRLTDWHLCLEGTVTADPLITLRLLLAQLDFTCVVVQVGLAQMLKGGVIMDVTNAEEARIAEEAGAVAVMALERVPADIRKEGGVARMSDPTMIREIKKAVTIPVMAKARIGHFVEAQILEALEVDYVDESEVKPFPSYCLASVHVCSWQRQMQQLAGTNAATAAGISVSAIYCAGHRFAGLGLTHVCLSLAGLTLLCMRLTPSPCAGPYPRR